MQRYYLIGFIFAIGCFPSYFVEASPNLQEGFQVENIRVFPDHANRNLYYFAPMNMELVVKDGTPEFLYSLYRYLGRQETGDKGEFRVRGILSFEVKQVRAVERINKIKEHLRKTNPAAILRFVPIKEFQSKLIYKTVEVESEDAETSGEVEGGVFKDSNDVESQKKNREGNWLKRHFTITLKPYTAELFWDNFEKDKLQLSLSYSWTVKGVIPDNETQGEWEESTSDIADTLPIQVSMPKYPALFRKIETWQEISMAHTNLLVLCYDFINEEESELYSISVEVKFKTLIGQDYVSKVRFNETDAEYEKKIAFRLAKELDAGYQYRIKRIFKNGDIENTQWKHHNDWVLDVTHEDSI
jgi:hypothetical protein